MEVKQQYLRMLRIQELAHELAQAQGVIDLAPARIEEIEGHFRDRNSEYVALRDRHDELDADQRERSAQVAELEERKKKYMQDLMQVQNQREYSAMLKEIDEVKVKISDHEDAILRAMEEIDSLGPKLAEFAQHIAEERKQVDQQRARVEADVAEARQRIERDRAERQRLESELPAALMDSIRRVEELRQGLFLVKVEDGNCQACYVRVRPQALQEIKTAAQIHACGQCKRFLYHEPSLKPGPARSEQTQQSKDASGVEAVNGGAL